MLPSPSDRVPEARRFFNNGSRKPKSGDGLSPIPSWHWVCKSSFWPSKPTDGVVNGRAEVQGEDGVIDWVSLVFGQLAR